MNDLIKAKVIIELLDDRKYSVLASFSDSELTKLNNMNLEELNALSSAQINTIISEFLTSVDQLVSTKLKESEKEVEKVPEPEIKKVKPSKRKKESEPVKASIPEKIQSQPAQLLACLIHQLDDEKKEFVLSNLSSDKKIEVEAIEVEKTPISNQVINILKSELEIA